MALVPAVAGCAGVSTPNGQSSACSTQLVRNAREFAVIVTMPDARRVPVTLFAPAAPGRYPLVAFSHGALAAPSRYRRMLRPLAAAGFIIVAPTHVESEELALPAAPTPTETWLTRAADLEMALAPPPAIVRQLTDRSLSIDPRHVAVMGHSFGALMAQIAAGARAQDPAGKLTQLAAPRLDAVIAWSPPGPLPGVIGAEGWASLDAASMLLTGTADRLAIMTQPWDWHLTSFDHAPAGNKRAWIGQDVDHYFNGSFGREKPLNPAAEASFARALSQVLTFLERQTGRPHPCLPDYDPTHETLKTG